ncbi:protein LZIC-like [Sitophilus oryzae]|uniref:Protein LZIC-like n=1 Tax=Sitophilus oryzae TaxID=7048 RepID=A0A6J2XJN2_SITOR|nr:protein LZIC-like [Sitophilus oryzae]
MTSHGKTETEKLKQNVENQLDRLMEQLADLESYKDNLDPAEYEETKKDTIEQLKELNQSLTKLVNGDMSLIDAVGAVQLATQAAISEAFKTPEVIRLFGRKEPKLLRERLKDIENKVKLNNLCNEAANQQKVEILTALRQLNEQLSSEELQFLQKHMGNTNEFKNIEFLELKD